MKIYRLVFFLSLIGLISACQQDDYVAPDEITDVSWIISGIGPNTVPSVNIDNWMSFMDVSQGTIEHSWTIPEGNLFLTPTFTTKDTVFEEHVIANAGNTSSDELIHVLFKNPGENKLILRNVFRDSVAYNGTEVISAVKEGDHWIFEKELVVDVYDKIKPAFDVLRADGTEIVSISADQEVLLADSASWPIVEVEAGAVLHMVDNTEIGRPETVNWSLQNSSRAGGLDNVTFMKFKTLGTYMRNFVRYQRGSANNPTPPRANVVKYIPVKFKVTIPTGAFTQDGSIVEPENDGGNSLIGVGLSEEVDGASVLSAASGFTVNVKNEGFDQNIDVSSVSVDGSDATKIWLKLSEDIYNSDQVTVSYADGGITSFTRPLEAFSNVDVVMHFGESILADDPKAGFEGQGNGGGWWLQHPDAWSVTDAVKFEGVQAMKFETLTDLEDNGVKRAWGPGDISVIPGNQYLVTLQIYRAPGSTQTALSVAFEKGWNRKSISFEHLPFGEWSMISRVYTMPADQPLQTIFIDIANRNDWGGGVGTLYFDDLQLIPMEARP